MFPGITAGTNCIPALVVVLAHLHSALCKPTFILVQKKWCICRTVHRTILCCFRELLWLSLPLEMRKKKNFKRSFAY